MGSTSADRLDRSVARPPFAGDNARALRVCWRGLQAGRRAWRSASASSAPGLMGHGMAKNIVEKGYELTVLAHRNRAPIEDLLGARRHRGEEPGRHRAGQRRPDPVRTVLGRGRGVHVRRERASLAGAHDGLIVIDSPRPSQSSDPARGQGACRKQRALRPCAAHLLAQGRRGRPAQHPGRRGRRHARRDPARARNLPRERLPRRPCQFLPYISS